MYNYGCEMYLYFQGIIHKDLKFVYTRKSYGGGGGEHSDVRSEYKLQGFAALIYCQQRQDGIAQNPAEV